MWRPVRGKCCVPRAKPKLRSASPGSGSTDTFLSKPDLQLIPGDKVNSHQTKAKPLPKAKPNIFFDVCRLFLSFFLFLLVIYS